MSQLTCADLTTLCNARGLFHGRLVGRVVRGKAALLQPLPQPTLPVILDCSVRRCRLRLNKVRSPVDADRVRLLLTRLGAEATGPGTVFLVGGATAVLEGWRQTTIDIDLKLDPEPAGVFAAIRRLKDELGVNIELASPDQFIPPLPGWRPRSRFVAKFGVVEVFHYDAYSQVLAKIERDHIQDRVDVANFVSRGFVVADELQRLFASILPAIERYPAIDAQVFADKVARTVASWQRL